MESGEEGVTPPDPPSEQEKKDAWVANWLDRLCPYYMFIGVSYEDFWYGDYTALDYYARAYDLQRQRKSEELWLAGLYNFNAVSVAIGNALRKKGTPPAKYLEEPIRITPLTAEEKAIKAEKERQKTIEYFNRLAKKWGVETEP